MDDISASPVKSVASSKRNSIFNELFTDVDYHKTVKNWDSLPLITLDTEHPHLLLSILSYIYSSLLPFPLPNPHDYDSLPENSRPSQIQQIFTLISLADSYLLEDLRRRCEDELLYWISDDNCVEILNLAFENREIIGDNLIENCISRLVEDWDVVVERYGGGEDGGLRVEQLLVKQEGLVARMLMFLHQRKNKFKRVGFLSRESSRDTFFSGL